MMSPDDTNLTCPHCGNEFDVADRLRVHIEQELRAEIQQTMRSEMDTAIQSVRSEEESKRELQDEVITEQRTELTGLRKSKLELDELKDTREVELAEAKAAGEKVSKGQLKKAQAEAKKAENDLEEIKQDHELALEKARAAGEKVSKDQLKKAQADAKKITDDLEELKQDHELALEKARADGEKVSKGQLKKAEAEAKKAGNDLEELKEDHELALERAKREEARKIKRQMNLELDETVNERLKELRGDDEVKIEKLRLELQRRDSKIEELEQQRTASHGELEGEALEQAVEQTLRNLHPRDLISEVKRGRFGADIEHSVPTASGTTAGKILWECKKHKQWQDAWISTIRKNSIEYGADTMVIVTTVMPDGMDSFGEVDGVFVCRYHETAVVSALLRHAILRVSGERTRERHMQTIQERVLEYVSGPEFSMVMQGVMQAYEAFEDDLRKEEQYMKTRWRARRGYLRDVIESVTSMLGRLEHLGAGDFDVVDALGIDQPRAFIEDSLRADEEE